MKFDAHGIFSVHIDNNLLFTDATGPFNEELIIQYQQALETCITALEQQGKWYQRVMLHELSLMTPDAEAIFTQSLKDRKARGLCGCAVVLETPEAQNLIEEQFGRAYRAANVTARFFTALEPANAWLKEIQ
ncbi:hypothetical protein K0504_04055 [Neiella marina]|uniref:STAS/SEC14 domain-containing protein n=1 Tax=Neiella holothuriorum TaxID=2870530 RepID=A0ABS7ED13_9GAMM|nr:hypothetical protein [Neiella holothuriorum]MBW8190201.1 hypothetical protein [Neiella holothuriorum]